MSRPHRATLDPIGLCSRVLFPCSTSSVLITRHFDVMDLVDSAVTHIDVPFKNNFNLGVANDDDVVYYGKASERPCRKIDAYSERSSFFKAEASRPTSLKTLRLSCTEVHICRKKLAFFHVSRSQVERLALRPSLHGRFACIRLKNRYSKHAALGLSSTSQGQILSLCRSRSVHNSLVDCTSDS